jgi:hypothetical protein
MGRSRPPTEPPPPAPTGLTPAVPRHGRLVPAPDTPLSDCPTNLHLGTPEGKRLAFNAASASDDSVPVGGRAHIRARWYIVHPAEQVDETTGELRHFARTVLIDDDGRTLSSCSDVLPHQLARALGLFTPADWEAGIEFEIVSRARKRGPGNYHDLRCVTVPGGEDTDA